MSDPYDPPTKIAFCKILHAANGGRFNEWGKPIFEEGVRGNCDDPHDCGNCGYFQSWIQTLAPTYVITWECQACVKWTKDVWRSLQGYYHEGVCQRCGLINTPLLQLVLRAEVLPPFPWPLDRWPPPDEE